MRRFRARGWSVGHETAALNDSIVFLLQSSPSPVSRPPSLRLAALAQKSFLPSSLFTWPLTASSAAARPTRFKRSVCGASVVP